MGAEIEKLNISIIEILSLHNKDRKWGHHGNFGERTSFSCLEKMVIEKSNLKVFSNLGS